ncbi:UDP-N-acetylglucosamine 2-epimerase (non-hydrolyzing), partial [bacterium]|nr:UDP-N-acetylglucosamine 2-epimerase (non-hydrolyzing) [bacterium]
MKIISVVGARPNFIKIAPFVRAIEEHNADLADEGAKIKHVLVHTGQHYDDKMSRDFFTSLNIPEADINLGIGSGSHAEQVGKTMIEFEKIVKSHQPDWVVVVGDVNATCACSITAKKEHIKVAHIEAGLRSFDMEMPEEINRLVTDRLSDLLLTPCSISSDNLRNEGVAEDRIKFVGNIMIDTLEANREKAGALDMKTVLEQNLYDTEEGGKLEHMIASSSGYGLMTMHRPSNVDRESILRLIIEFLKEEVVHRTPLIWPMHPRTEKQLTKFGLWDEVKKMKGLLLLQPLGYHELLKLNMSAKLVLTDSGGIQEECCVLGTPCLTMRWNTERPIT